MTCSTCVSRGVCTVRADLRDFLMEHRLLFSDLDLPELVEDWLEFMGEGCKAYYEEAKATKTE